MASSDVCLGVYFSNHQYYYAVNDPENELQLRHIGCIDFNAGIRDSLTDM